MKSLPKVPFLYKLKASMHLYFHIPFCQKICPYCSFYKHTPDKTKLALFVQAVVKEIGYHTRQHSLSKVRTLYIGGGTPSLLSPRLLHQLFEGIRSQLDLSEVTEITFEANPATFSKKRALLYKKLGITRVSLGIQSFSNPVLKVLGREHSREQAINSVHLLHDAGIPEVNIDLMFAIPGQPLEQWVDTINTTIGLRPKHISAYNLTYEEDTEFIDKLTKGEFNRDDETNAEHFEASDTLLTAAGFLHYETSNFAQPGFESQHNQGYWQGNDYLGIGPSAVGTIEGQRYRNIPDTNKYISMIQSLGHARQEIEIIDREAFRIERIALLLRTSDGIPEKWLKYSPEGVIETLLEERLAERIRGNIKLVNNGKMLVDSIAEQLV